MSEHSLRIWGEPLTDSERALIGKVSGDENRKWLNFLLAVYDANAARHHQTELVLADMAKLVDSLATSLEDSIPENPELVAEARSLLALYGLPSSA